MSNALDLSTNPSKPQLAARKDRHYTYDTSSRQWRRKGSARRKSPVRVRPDIRTMIAVDSQLTTSLLTSREASDLLDLIVPAIVKRYGHRAADSGTFWSPHAWGTELDPDAFNRLRVLVFKIRNRINATPDDTHDAREEEYRMRLFAADLSEVFDRRNRRGFWAIDRWAESAGFDGTGEGMGL
jgi:hypothetical protein